MSSTYLCCITRNTLAEKIRKIILENRSAPLLSLSCIHKKIILIENIVRLLVQRIKEGKVTIGGEEVSRTSAGLCLFLSIAKGDTQEDANYLANKAVELRIFEDNTGKFDRSLLEVHGEVLVVSEFTLHGDCSKGRRPSFSQAAPPREAETLYYYFVQRLKDHGLKVATGKFQSKMEVSITNDGPVTFLLDSR